MALPKLGEKKICFGNCGDGIAENVKKKKIDLAIVAMPLPKMKKKNIVLVLSIVAMALLKMEKKKKKDVPKSVKE